MIIKKAVRAVFVAASVAVGSTALADVTLSASNDPTIDLSSRMDAFFGAEHSALSSLQPDDLNGLVRAPDPEVETPDFMTMAHINSLPNASGGEEWACLSEALYFEARGEALEGIFGVAEVILNRVDDRRYPRTICGVVNQGTGERYRCQFTYTCDGRPETIRDQSAYAKVAKVARIMVDGAPRTLTNGATHYHTKSVNPRWARVFPRTTTIGYHHFYREPGGNAES